MELVTRSFFLSNSLSYGLGPNSRVYGIAYPILYQFRHQKTTLEWTSVEKERGLHDTSVSCSAFASRLKSCAIWSNKSLNNAI